MNVRRLLALLSSATLGAAIVGTPTPVQAHSTIYVGPGGGSGACKTPGAPYLTDGSADNVQIQNAVDSAASGDTINLCPGRYDITGEVNLGSKSLIIQGAGRERTQLDAKERDTRFFYAGNATITFKGLTMQNAHQSGYVGAIWGEGATNIIIQSSSFLNNYALDGMGVVFSRNGNISVVDSTFEHNYSDTEGDVYYGGGAINATGDSDPVTVTIRNSTFINNYSVGDGGAILSRGSLNITDSVFLNNESESNGGALAVYGDLRLTRSRFSGNITHDEGASSYVEGCTSLVATNNRFTDNHAVGFGSDGGAFNLDCDEEASILINKNTFSDNMADDAGAVLDEDNGSVVILTNNQIIGNYSGVASNLPEGGGAIWANRIRMTRNVFVRNTTAGCGGAVYISTTDYGSSRQNFFGSNKGEIGAPDTYNVCFGSDVYGVD